jgi:hypothetical protein
VINDLVRLVNVRENDTVAPPLIMSAFGTGSRIIGLGGALGSGGESGFWAQITASELLSYHYSYTWSEVEKSAAGWSGFTVKDGGRSGVANAYNAFEIAGLGEAVPNNAIVWMVGKYTFGEADEWWFVSTPLQDVATMGTAETLLSAVTFDPNTGDFKAYRKTVTVLDSADASTVLIDTATGSPVAGG